MHLRPHQYLGGRSRCQTAEAGMKGIEPPHVDESDKPLRREVAMAHRSAREAGHGDDVARQAAIAVFRRARPEVPQLEASERVAAMIASAVLVDPAWFRKKVR
jgi:hypothetical protein